MEHSSIPLNKIRKNSFYLHAASCKNFVVLTMKQNNLYRTKCLVLCPCIAWTIQIFKQVK